MTRRSAAAAALLAAAALATPAHPAQQTAGAQGAGQTEEHQGYHLIFRTGTLDRLKEGDALSYAADRQGADPRRRGAHGGLTLRLAPEGKAQLTRTEEDGPERPVAAFDATVGNPMAMYFLESTVRDLAELTGGSPFYIRNRIKEALLAPRAVEQVAADWNGKAAEATRITLAPFEGDANAARMGPFAGLSLAVTVSEAAPGWYLALAAEAPGETAETPVYAVRITLQEGPE